MKKCLSVCLCILFLLTMVPLGALPAVMAEGETESVVLNVKDFGAVGDGKTDDRTAIMETFHTALLDYMQYDIPVTVYFPEGQYGLLAGGMYIYLPRGYGNLTVKGDGADKSTIVYLDEWSNNGSWVALRIQPKITPASVEEYLHDITIQDLGVYDTDPAKHAWHTDKGDPSTEETHGFNIQYCVRATIKNCQTIDVGDECFDMSHCIDSVMTENLVIKNRITGKGGGSISVGDGSKNVTITDNTVMFNVDEDDSTSHYGVAVEALSELIEGIVIANNTLHNINGWGINIGAPNGTIDNVLIENNTMELCNAGGVRFMGTGLTTNAIIRNNYINKTRIGVLLEGKNKEGVVIEDCVIENLSNYAINVNSTGQKNTIVRDVTIRNALWRAIYNAGVDTKIDRIMIDGVGTAGGITDSAIIQYASGGSLEISNSIILNCQNKRGIQGVAKVSNTYIQQPEISGYAAMTGVAVIENCWVNRAITLKSGAVVDGLVLYTTADLGTHAIVLSNLTDCTVKNCILTMPSRYGISEAGTANNNTITNNVCIGGSGVKVVGADTVVADNVRSTLAVGEQFTYRVVDGAVTVMAPVDSTLTTLEIPATIDGNPVVAIDPWAFALCGDLTTVSLPDTLTSIGDYTFYDCDALTTVLYGGLESQRQAVTLGVENTPLTNAEWTYHWNNHTYDNACDTDCNDCPVTREVGDHVYDNACDTACNECGILREVPDHVYEPVVTEPDCVNGGYTTYTCTVCGDSYITDETVALGHTYDAVVTPPTCANSGYTTYTCTVCGDRYIADEIEALDHTYDAVVTDPDCTNGGYTTYTCTVCGHSYVADETAALGHICDAVVTEPDCTNGGYTTYTCTVCGHSYIADETEALGHFYDVTATSPGCETGGYTTYVCWVCGYSYVADETAARGHSYNAVVTAPDCVNGGYTTHTCLDCGDSYVTDETAALGHSYDAVVTAPDCVNGGYTTCTCLDCGDSYVTDETAALGHDYDAVVTVPDCVNGGYTTYTCLDCGDSYVADEVAATGHVYDNACDATCNACGAVREVSDHVYDDDNDATCNECGLIREVATVTYGDVNGDGKINNKDLGLLQQYVNGWDVAVDVKAADANGDGKVNNKDLGLLQQYVNGWDVELG